jgi:hypothetical protein
VALLVLGLSLGRCSGVLTAVVADGQPRFTAPAPPQL